MFTAKMDFVEPIRGRKKIAQIKNLLRGQKRHEAAVNGSMHEALDEYLAVYPDIVSGPDNLVFFNSQANGYAEPIKRGQAWKLISRPCHEAGRPSTDPVVFFKTWIFGLDSPKTSIFSTGW